MTGRPSLSLLKVREALENHLQILTVRDRRALQVLSLFLLASVCYWLFWQPLSSWSQIQKQDYRYQKNVHHWVKLQINQLPDTVSLAPENQQSLSSTLSQTAQASGLTLNRIQPNQQGVSVWLEQTAFEDLLPWLKHLELEQKLTIEQIRIDRKQQAGLVKAFVQVSQ